MAIFVMVYANSVAQQPTQTIRGTVTENASNAALPYVSIILQNSNYGTTSDSLGNFIIRHVSLGRYNIQFTMLLGDHQRILS